MKMGCFGPSRHRLSPPGGTREPSLPGPGAAATPPGWRDQLRQWARALKRDAIAIFLALRDPRTPWSARVVGFLTCAYAFSPIDLIPDFIPIIGQLDDLLLVPLGVLLTRRLIPDPLWAEFRARADEISSKPLFPGSLLVVIATWFLAIGLGAGLVMALR